MADLREDFVNYVVKALVSTPDAVEIKRMQDDKGEYLELKVDSADMGKVIGKAGATAKSLRTLLRAVGAKDDMAPLPLKIVEPDGQTVDLPAETEDIAEAPIEQPPAADDHTKLHEQTKKELADLADLEF